MVILTDQNQFYEFMYSDPKVKAMLLLGKTKYRFLKLAIDV